MKYLYVFVSSLVLSIFLTPLLKGLSFKLCILDHPNYRKIHQQPIPLMGGIAIFISFVFPLLFFGGSVKLLWGVLLVGLFFVIFGFLDDAGIKIRARYKIWSHLAFSFLFVYLTGICFNLFSFPYLNCILTACFITFMTNSMNMLDGMDGLVSGVGMLSSLFFFILALNNGLNDVAFISLALAGACLGFLKYNFNPASIFLGETGSTLIGFLLAVIALKLKIFHLWNITLMLGIQRLQFVSFIVPLIILGIPIFDTLFVFINRFINKMKMSTPGKDHSHHRIQLMGFSQKATVLTLYCVQIVLGAIALTMINSDFQQFLSLILIVLVLIVFSCVFLLKIKVYSQELSRQD